MPRQITLNGSTSLGGGIYRWGMLVVILALIGWSILIQFGSVQFSWRQFGLGLVVPVMLLLNHLAFAFRWPKVVGIAMSTLAFTWLVIGGYLIFAGR